MFSVRHKAPGTRGPVGDGHHQGQQRKCPELMARPPHGYDHSDCIVSPPRAGPRQGAASRLPAPPAIRGRILPASKPGISEGFSCPSQRAGRDGVI